MAEESYIDLDNKKKIILTETDVMVIRENPSGLTKEGAQVEFNDWFKNSKNRYMQARYTAMLKKCKNFTKSGKLQDGRVILSRKPKKDKEGIVTDSSGEPKWVEWVNIDYKRLNRKKWEALPEEKRL